MAQKLKQVKIDEEAHAHLATLRKGLWKAGIGKDADHQDILSALVLYTTPPQLAGMLSEYWRYTEQRDAAEEAAKNSS
ncbi:MAG TPA: hypothetical protein VNM38_11840 [Solirubrobacterales bacterium]|nr:hypothetical protein [Solirubrobacterales bacterium]